jgi:hypothetical protein
MSTCSISEAPLLTFEKHVAGLGIKNTGQTQSEEPQSAAVPNRLPQQTGLKDDATRQSANLRRVFERV